MKKYVYGLILFTSIGIAQEKCCDCHCQPCCVPEPKKCIELEAYTPAYYDLQCDWGLFALVDFLYWYARETNLTYAARVVNQQTGSFVQPRATPSPVTVFLTNLVPESYKNLSSAWKPGFRVGLGINSSCDGWDALLDWTYYHNTKKSSTSVDDFSNSIFLTLPNVDQPALMNPWLNQGFSMAALSTLTPATLASTMIPYLFDSISAKWKLNFNQIDLELGRKYWLSRCFTLRPFLGLRGAWIKTNFTVTSSRDETFSRVNSGQVVTSMTNFSTLCKDRFINHNWGVGLLGGIQPNWHFTQRFILFGNVDMALLWGNGEAKKKENYTQHSFSTPPLAFETTTTEVNILLEDSSKSNFSLLQPVLDLGIGFRWEETWCCNRFRTELDLGWEHHIWFDLNERIKTSGSMGYTNIVGGRMLLSEEDLGIDLSGSQVATTGFQTFTEVVGNLGLGGLVVRFRFDF